MSSIFNMTHAELEIEVQVLQEELLEAEEVYGEMNRQIENLMKENSILRERLIYYGMTNSQLDAIVGTAE